jgi:hypothetical protein
MMPCWKCGEWRELRAAEGTGFLCRECLRELNLPADAYRRMCERLAREGLLAPRTGETAQNVTWVCGPHCTLP